MKSLISKVLDQNAFKIKPPVLVDLGASGKIHDAWRLVAPYSICLAFDADIRDFSIKSEKRRGFLNLKKINRLVKEDSVQKADFFLTKSPHCSSSLKPNDVSLSAYAFSDLFNVQSITRLPVISLVEALKDADLDYIDWYKSDTQGTDLRLFASLSDKIKTAILVAEFEPGLIDAYFGEDKLHHLLSHMDKMPFWISRMDIKGSSRIRKTDYRNLNFFQKKSLNSFLKIAPGWCEIRYFNKFDHQNSDYRDYLLAWVFAMIGGEYGFALELSICGKSKFGKDIFDEMFECSKKYLRRGYAKFIVRAILKVSLLFKK